MPCGENAQCVNLEGSHSCFCLEGYEGNATILCESKTTSDSIDLCAEGSSILLTILQVKPVCLVMV